MKMIDVLLPDGSVHVHTTVEQSNNAIDAEVTRLVPEASCWRLSKDWRSVTGEEQPSVMSITWARAKPVAIVLALAIILTPVMTWVSARDDGSAAVFARFREASSAGAVEADELDADPVAEPAGDGCDAGIVGIVGIDEQSSDTSRTLRVHVRNYGAQTHEDVRVHATFYDIFDMELPEAEGSVGKVTLAPGQEGYVKVWAHSPYGVGQFELEILDPAP